MSSWRNVLSPWAVGGLIFWLLILAVASQWTIPVFANVLSGPECTPRPCAVSPTTEWLPSLLLAALVASVISAASWGIVTWIRRNR